MGQRGLLQHSCQRLAGCAPERPVCRRARRRLPQYQRPDRRPAAGSQSLNLLEDISMRQKTVLLLTCALVATAAFAEDSPTEESTTTTEQPDATVDLTGGSFALGVGYVWGNGSLKYQGAERAFKFSGVSVV